MKLGDAGMKTMQRLGNYPRLFLILIPIIAFAQVNRDLLKYPSDRDLMEIRGLVKSVSEKYFTTERLIDLHTNVDEKLFKSHQFDFDINGKRLLPCSLYPLFCGENKGGNPDESVVTRLDANGRIIEITTSSKDGQIRRIESRLYDASNNLIKRTLSSGGGMITESQEYGKNGKMLERWTYQSSTQSTYEKFNEQGLFIEGILIFGPAPETHIRITVKRNEQGDQVENLATTEDQYFMCDKTVSSYEYDENGNWIKSLTSVWEFKENRFEHKHSTIRIRTIKYFGANDGK